jgi:hypothetical protein
LINTRKQIFIEQMSALIKYLIIFEKTGTGFSAYVPDLPGCIATGKTKNIVEKNILYRYGICNSPIRQLADYNSYSIGICKNGIPIYRGY